MKLSTIVFSVVALSLFTLTGCKQESATTVSKTESHEDLDHAEGEHDDHSVAGHGHAAGPNDGTIVDWGGGKFHVEFTVDHDKQESTVYVFGPDEKSAVPIDAEAIDLSISDPVMQVTLKAAPQDSDPAGKASRFIGNHEKLGVVQEYAGTISGVIDGTPYSGDFAEEAHDDHDH
ncbi:hypothetical protein [Rhodopirellula sp. P2]|uniref:hypothetical protein n=1 Tax=Rhodopirellula sp. P2 TaxID=2127060 RepID=UPI0023684692|nr:hypothetical protein [Rhodopirellula sp. P2]WDQ18079.1 hypothetical protein PSR62_05875 [Rhodopirellula sp. P2]